MDEHWTWRGVGGIPTYSKTQLKQYFGMNDALIGKLPEPNVKVCRYEHPDFYGYSAEMIENILTETWMQEELKAIQDKRRKWHESRAARPVDMTEKHLAEALYIINKSAKKSRDTKNDAYYRRNHQVCHSAKTRAANLYAIKDAVLSKLIADGKAQYIGVNVQVSTFSRTYLKLYAYGGFTFHLPCREEDVKQSEILADRIEGIISAEADKTTSINYTQAVQVLNDYLKSA